MMRTALVVLFVAIVTALLFGFLGQAVQSDALYLISGLAFLVALGSGVALIPWVRNLPWPQKMERLFPAMARGDRLDPRTGERLQ